VNIIVTFVILFAGGPLVFRYLIRGAFGQRVLGILAAICMITAIGVRYGFEDMWDDDFRLTIMALFLIWMAWIAVLALGAQALRSALLGKRTMRWTSIIGSAGTTVPWFGLASASWIEG
jgi:hypothetical protein